MNKQFADRWHPEGPSGLVAFPVSDHLIAWRQSPNQRVFANVQTPSDVVVLVSGRNSFFRLDRHIDCERGLRLWSVVHPRRLVSPLQAPLKGQRGGLEKSKTDRPPQLFCTLTSTSLSSHSLDLSLIPPLHLCSDFFLAVTMIIYSVRLGGSIPPHT
jgi:hypothetical protein